MKRTICFIFLSLVVFFTQGCGNLSNHRSYSTCNSETFVNLKGKSIKVDFESYYSWSTRESDLVDVAIGELTVRGARVFIDSENYDYVVRISITGSDYRKVVTAVVVDRNTGLAVNSSLGETINRYVGNRSYYRFRREYDYVDCRSSLVRAIGELFHCSPSSAVEKPLSSAPFM